MGELISKQSASNALEKCRKHCCREDEVGDRWIHYETALNEIESIPSAQPEIIRCKDCKHYEYGICKKAGLCVNKSPNGFCDWGERREVTT